MAWHSLLQYLASLQLAQRLMLSQMTPQPKHADCSFLEFMSASFSNWFATSYKSIKLVLNTKQLSIFPSTINVFSCFSAYRMATVLPCFRSDQANVVGSSSLSFKSRITSSPNGVKPLQHLNNNYRLIKYFNSFIVTVKKKQRNLGCFISWSSISKHQCRSGEPSSWL